jgi:hypothetical protein
MGYGELSKVGLSLGINGIDDTIALIEEASVTPGQPAKELSK